MKLLEILKRMLSCAATEASESTEVSKSTVLPLVDSNKESKDYADLEDIRLVVGDKTLALVYNVRLAVSIMCFLMIHVLVLLKIAIRK